MCQTLIVASRAEDLVMCAGRVLSKRMKLLYMRTIASLAWTPIRTNRLIRGLTILTQPKGDHLITFLVVRQQGDAGTAWRPLAQKFLRDRSSIRLLAYNESRHQGLEFTSTARIAADIAKGSLRDTIS